MLSNMKEFVIRHPAGGFNAATVTIPEPRVSGGCRGVEGCASSKMSRHVQLHESICWSISSTCLQYSQCLCTGTDGTPLQHAAAGGKACSFLIILDQLALSHLAKQFPLQAFSLLRLLLLCATKQKQQESKGNYLACEMHNPAI